MAASNYPVTPEMMAVALAYRNKELIADLVMPRAQVGLQDFKWLEHDLSEGFTIPDLKVGRFDKANQQEFKATERTATTQNFAITRPVSQQDVMNAANLKYDPVLRAVEGARATVALGREKRVADVTFNVNNYGDNNKVTLSGTDQWSDYTNSDPIADIKQALNTPIMRPNTMVIGANAWSALQSHPKIVSSVLGNSGTSGIATQEQVARLFGLREVLVGDSRVNTARKGQDLNLDRVWGNHCALVYKDLSALAPNDGVPTWGMTAQFGEVVIKRKFDEGMGLFGAHLITVGESVKELIIAPDLGFLFRNVAA